MPKIYKYKGEDISEEFVTEGFEQSSFTTLDDYIANTNGLEVVEEKVEKPKDVVEKDATVTSIEPEQASESMELEQVDTSLVSEDPEPTVRKGRAQVRQKELTDRKQAIEQKKRNDLIAAGLEAEQYEKAMLDVDKTLTDAGSSIWSYTPENISNLYSKTTGEGVDYQTIESISPIGSSKSYTGIFKPYSSFLTGGFSYSDFADNEKIKGISISELQKADQSNAASEVLEGIIEKHGEKSDEFVVDQGQVILKGKDKKLQELYSSLRNAKSEDKQIIIDQIKKVREDNSQELFDINTGNLIKYDKLPEESKKQYDAIVEKAEEKASTTELSELKKELTNSYSNLVGISKRISSFVDENGEDEITRKSQTTPEYLVSVVKDFFGSEETTYGDLSRVKEISETGVLPENVSKISGEHPLAKAYNKALEDYAVLNRAVQTNTDPLSEEQEGFWESAGDVLLEKIDMTGGIATPKVKATANQAFVNSVEKAGLGRINQEEVDEAVSQNWKSVVGGGAVDLTLFVGELALFKGGTANKIGKGFKFVEKAFKASEAARSSKVLRKAGDFVIKGMDEAAVFTGLETTKTSLGLSQQSTREQEWATATFGFALGGGNSLGSGILRALPAKSIFSPITAQLSKSDLARSVGNRFVNANAGAFSFEFARASTAALSGDEEGYYDRNPEEFVKEYLAEVAKMSLLGAKSIFHKNGIYKAAQRDMRLLNLNPTYVSKAAKRTGVNAELVRKPGEDTIDQIDAARADKMSGIDAKLKTQQITEEQAKKEIEDANKDYNILEAEAELNLAKKRFDAENKSALKPTDESVRILIQKMKKGDKFNDKDNNALVNTPLPIIYDRMGVDSSTKSLENRWNREFAIEDVMNNNTDFKAPYGSKERADSYKFLDEVFEVGGQIQLLKKTKNRNEAQEKELQQLEKDYKVYEPGGYKYDKLQDKLDQLYLKQRLASKAQAEDVLSATQEGESVSVRSAEDFQEKYNSIVKDGQDVKLNDGFYDPSSKVFYINEEVVKAIRNVSIDKHEAGHFILRDSLKDKAGKVTDEGIKVINEVLNELTPKQKEVVQKRIDRFYKYDESGKERLPKDYYEEYLTVLSDAINEKQIVFKDNVGNAFEKLVPFLRKKMPELELNADTGKNLFELIKSYSKGEKVGIEAAKKMSIAAEGAEAKGKDPLKSLSVQDSNKVNEIYKESGIAGAMEVLDLLEPTARGLARRFKNRPQYDEQLIIDEIMTGKRGMLDVIMNYNKKVEAGEDMGPLSGYINNSFSTKTGFKRYIEIAERIVGKEFTEDVTEAKTVTAEEVPTEVSEERVTKKIKPSSLVPSDAVAKIKKQVTEKIKEIPADKLTFKKLGDLAPEIIAEEIGIPVKKLVDPKANLSKGDANAIQRFVNKNADKLLKILPEGAVLEAATEKLMGTSTGVPKGLLNAFYTKQKRISTAAGLAPFTKNANITKADFLKAFGIVEGRKAEDFSARSPQAQALKGMANLYGRLVTNEIARTETDLELEAKQDIAAGKSKVMFSLSQGQLKELKKRGYEDIGKDYFSKVPENVLPYLVKLNTVTQKGAIAKELEDISENLDEQSYNNLYNKWLKPYVELKYVKNNEKWPSAEQDVLRNIKSLVKSGKVEGLKSIQDNINKDSSKLDIVFEIEGQDVAVEVKKTAGARLGQIHLHNEFGKTYVNKLSEEFANKIVEGDNQASKVKLIEFLEKNYPSEIKKEKNKRGEDIYVVTDGAYGAAIRLKALQESRHKIKLPITLVSDLYNNKDGNYIQFGDMGTFYMGKNKMSFNVASLEQINPKTGKLIDVDVTYMWKAYNRADGTKSLKRIAVPQLTTESKNVLSKVKTLNIGTESQLESMLKSPGYQPLTPFSKSKKEEKAKSLDKTFNDIIENKTGIPSRKRYGIVEATTKGSSKGKFNFFIPPSAEDFVGLLYPTLGKGKVGDSQMTWYKNNLINPYAKAMNKLSKARVYMLNNYKTLKNQLGVVPKDLAKKIEGTDYTKEMAVRVYIWNKQKMDVPGISKSDVRKLSDFVVENENLQTFADQLINLQLGDSYIKPKEGWAAGTITTDILEGLNTTKRSKYLKQWQENADAIFSEENMNKLQAVYGLNYVKALQNMLGRMKSGRNRSFPGDSATGRFTDWVTGSVGVTMFLNTRSAVLQTISAINFVNFTDNNILAAGKAFANQKQYWKDFTMLMNSDFLKERRGGLRINVSEADIADMAKKGGVKGAISKLLELGFAPTQIADSFAIASGGSTFYRNRVNTYKKQGLSDKQAEKKAFEDFRETAEESQQSSRADRISMQQASPVGRFVLAFANTPAQYARIIKKAASDLKNGRGDTKTNISKIIYYGAAQNILFNALQQALFATALSDEEPEDKEKEKKYLGIANGMMDSLLRGAGIGGSLISVGKNAVIKIVKELEKDRPKLRTLALELAKISPPISAKLSRLDQAGKSYDWNKDEMREKGLSLDNPAYLAGGKVVSALTNIPIDRAIKKANNVVQATSQDLEAWERLALLAGWSDWELGIKKEKPKKAPKSKKVIRKKIIKKKVTK